MHILCNTIQVTTISGIFLKGISDRFIINLHLPYKIPNALSTHILVEDCMEFEFVYFLDGVVFPPLNGQYIQYLTEYAASPINLYGWNLPSIGCKRVQFLSLEILPNCEDSLPTQTHNPKTCNSVQQFSAKLLNEMTFYSNNLLCLVYELKHEYVIHLLHLLCKVFRVTFQTLKLKP